jgi:hypothetical protein
MKSSIFSLAVILVLSIGGLAQKSKPSREVTLDSGMRIDGQLQSTVDVQKAHVGDQVILKTTKDIRQGGRTVVPKGSQLIGHVTQIQQRTRQNGMSRLGMVFDRIKGQDLSAPISASIVNVTSAATHATLNDSSADADVLSSSSSSTRSSGGGLLSGVSNTTGGVLNTTTSAVGGITNSVGNTVGNTVNTAGRTVSGLQISNSTSGSAQAGTTLSASDRNVKIEKGATIQLQLNSAARVE